MVGLPIGITPNRFARHDVPGVEHAQRTCSRLEQDVIAAHFNDMPCAPASTHEGPNGLATA